MVKKILFVSLVASITAVVMKIVMDLYVWENGINHFENVFFAIGVFVISFVIEYLLYKKKTKKQ